jgi:hypothetical protein
VGRVPSYIIYIAGIIATVMLCPVKGDSQLFTPMNESLGVFITQPNSSLGTGITVFDLDEDGLDDIVLPRNTGSTLLLRNTGNGFSQHVLFTNSQEIKAVILGDYDRDGDADAFCTYRYANPRLYRNNGTFPFEDVTNASGLANLSTGIMYGNTWGDYNGDGWLDLYFAVYNGESRFLMRNNGDGTFTNVAESAGLPNFFSYPFQPVIFDIDQDGDQDLDVIADYAPMDELHLNDGSGHFADYAIDAGYSVAIYSMSNSWSDYDHDGDYDKYIGELPGVGNHLFENDGNLHFTDVAEEKGLALYQFTWGCNWIDIDNDTWDDLYLTNTTFDAVDFDRVFMNTGGEFTEYPLFAGNPVSIKSHACAKGDFNNDGYYDLVVGSMAPGPTTQIYYNIGGENNYVKLDLHGITSNPHGYGARIEYHAGDQHITRPVLSSHGYLSQDSQHLILSMGSATQLDSLAIFWPSGIVDRYDVVPAGVKLSATEGQPASLWLTGNEPICEGDSVLITTDANLPLHWSTGETAASFWRESGTYSGWHIDEEGMIWYSDTVTVQFHPVTEADLQVIHPTCYQSADGSVTVLNSGDFQTISWNEELSQPALLNLPAGVVGGHLTDQNNCESYVYVELTEPDSLSAVLAASNATCHGSENGSLEVASLSGGTPPYSMLIGGVPETISSLPFLIEELSTGQYDVLFFDSHNCLLFHQISIQSPDLLVGQLIAGNNGFTCEVEGGTPPYSIQWSTGSTQSWSGDLTDGEHYVMVTDSLGCTWQESFTHLFVQEQGVNVLDCLSIHSESVQWKCGNGTQPVSLFDLAGRMLYADLRNPAGHIPSGIYLLRYTDQAGHPQHTAIRLP